MYDIEELEGQWRRYKRRRMIRHGLAAVGILILLGLPILYVTFKPFTPSISEKNNTRTVAAPVKESEKKIGTTQEKSASAMKSAAVLTPEVPSMQKETAAVPKKKPKMLISFSDGTGEASQERVARGKVELDMVRRADANVVRELEKRFPLSRDYDDAMYLAKYYYGKRLYKKAEYWAMQANTVDSTQPESWIIFGKAKAKRGHRKEALRVLQKYYDNTGNMEVKTVIDKIRKGQKF